MHASKLPECSCLKCQTHASLPATHIALHHLIHILHSLQTVHNGKHHHFQHLQ